MNAPTEIRTAKGAADWFLRDMEALAAARVKHTSAARIAKARKSIHGPFGGPEKVPPGTTARYPAA